MSSPAVHIVTTQFRHQNPANTTFDTMCAGALIILDLFTLLDMKRDMNFAQLFN